MLDLLLLPHPRLMLGLPFLPRLRLMLGLLFLQRPLLMRRPRFHRLSVVLGVVLNSFLC